jgi:hypothetical protein
MMRGARPVAIFRWMKPSRRVLVLAITMTLAAGARAERYAVQLNDGPTIYVGDCNEALTNYEPATGMKAPTPQSLAALVVPAAPAPPAVPAGSSTLGARVETAGQDPTPGTEGDLTDVTDPVPMPPDAAFMEALNRVYTITDQNEINAVWAWFQKESPGLALDQRVGNSVVRFIMAVNKAPTGDTNAAPDKLKPEATRGVVRSSNGVGVRASPWGPSGGAAIPSGASLEIIPPAQGPWYKVRTGGGEGWVAGVWLDLQ